MTPPRWTSAALLALAGCSAPATHARAPHAPSTSTAAATDSASPCVRAARVLVQGGDLDGALVALASCAASDLEGRATRMDVLVELGDVTPAKGLAESILTEAKAGYAPEEGPIVRRAHQVIALADPPVEPALTAIAHARSDLASALARPKADRPRALALARHAIARAHGTPGEAILVQAWGAGRWAADHPAWDVQVRPLALGGTFSSFLAIGDATESAVELRALVPTEGPGTVPVALGDDAGTFAVSSPGGVRVFQTGQPPRVLDAEGTPIPSPTKRELAVLSRTQVVFYDAATWTRRATVSVNGHASGRYSSDGAYLFLPSGEGVAAVLDVERASVWMDERSQATVVTPSADAIVTLAESEEAESTWTLSIHTIGAIDRPRRITYQRPSLGYTELAVDGDRVRVIENIQTGHMGTLREVVGQYALATGARVAVTRADEDAAKKDPADVLLASLESALPPQTKFMQSGIGAIVVSGPAANGAVAASGTRCLDATCATSELSLLVIDARAKKLLQNVPLSVKDGFAPEAVAILGDGRFALACGSGTFGVGAFVVDVETSRSTLLGGVSDCTGPIGHGGRLLTPAGLRALDGDQTSLQWPALVPVDIQLTSSNADDPERAASWDGPGRYCRFGNVLEPIEACVSKN
ncbi:MAG: hypothetical protein U0414_32010 [Polyangiaceae bacterium]